MQEKQLKALHQSKSVKREDENQGVRNTLNKGKQFAMLDLNMANKCNKITYQINETPKLTQRTNMYFGGEN